MRRFFLLGFFLGLLFLLTSLIPQQTQADLDSANKNCDEKTVSLPGGFKVPAIPCQQAENYTFDPPRITADVPIVTVTFTHLRKISGRKGVENWQFYYCLKTNPFKCTKDDLNDSNDNAPEVTKEPGPKGESTFDDGTFKLIFKVCGDGDSKLKTKCKTDGSDWFWPGKTYTITLFEREDPKSQIVASASFYVYRFYPIPKINIPLVGNMIIPFFGTGNLTSLNVDEIKKNGGKLNIKITLTGSTTRGRGDASRYNDYWISFDGYDTDYSTSKLDSHQCIFVKPPDNKNPTEEEKASSSGSGTIEAPLSIPLEDTSTQELTAGVYYIKIVDGIKGNYDSLPDNYTSKDVHCDEGDFTYWYIPLTLTAGVDPKTKAPRAGNIGAPIRDPLGKEIGVTQAVPPAEPPCLNNLKDENGYCAGVYTAIGVIHTNPTAFIRDLFTIVLSVGGIAAFAFFLRAGYTILTSGGNKEKVGQAREQITSAVTGLIFIILSIAILEFIGINILHIPGFK